MVEGKNCAIRLPVKRRGLGSLFGKREVPKKTGFFATRFTVAETASEAERIVIDSIRRELESQWGIENSDLDPPVFLVSETRHVASSDDPGVEAKGFTFYADDERH